MSHLYARRLSPYFTLAAHRAGLRPDSVTVLMVFVGVLGGITLAGPSLGWALGSALLIQLYLVLDCSDGELARVLGTSSARGVFLDRFGHYLVESLLLIALGIRVSQGEPAWVLVGAVTAVAAILVKVQSDLVTASRAAAQLGPIQDAAYQPGTPQARRLRTLIGRIPLQRLLGAVELSIAVLVVATFEVVLSRPDTFQRVLAICLLAIAVVGIPIRLWLVMKSDRLDP